MRKNAKQLPESSAGLTTAAEYDRARQISLVHLLAHMCSRGRPTKKDRCEMGRLFDFE